MVSTLLGPDCAFGVVDAQGRILWQSAPNALGYLSPSPGSGGIQGDESPGARLEQSCPAGHVQAVVPLDVETIDTDLFWVGLTRQATFSPLEIDACHGCFNGMGHLIETMANLCLENDTMVADLSRRYEELNLLYRTESDTSELKGTLPSLDKAVKSMIEFMDVPVSFLLVPDINIAIIHTRPDTKINVRDAAFTPWLYEQLKALGQDPAPRVLDEKSHAPFLMILAGIDDGQSRRIGAVGCLRHKDGPEFVTGDKRLLTVLSQQVQKVLTKYMDSLTGATNRLGFEDQLGHMMATRDWHTPITVGFVKIDQFKLVRDAYGMAMGDKVLKRLARSLEGQIRKNDLLSRIEGDQFTILFDGAVAPATCTESLNRIRKNIASAQLRAGGRMFKLTLSMGVVLIKTPRETIPDILARGESALGAANKKGGNCIVSPGDDDENMQQIKSRATYASQIDRLIDQNRFVLFCQPIVPLAGGRMHYEILIRLRGEDGTIISPFEFLPAAEQYNKMALIDKWVLEETVRLLGLHQAMLAQQKITWSVNLSGQSLQDQAFIDYFLKFLARLSLPPEWLCFEITETVAIQNFDRVSDIIAQMKFMGFSFSMDDFGTGYSSFSYLKKMPVSFLKIDGAFVRRLDQDEFDKVTVQSIVAIAHHLKIETIAEFVENEAVLTCLKTFGVDYAQGYHTGKPVGLQETLTAIGLGAETDSVLPLDM